MGQIKNIKLHIVTDIKVAIMAENDIGDWFRGIPIVTRWWFSLSIIFPLLGRIGLFHPYYMILDFELVAYKFQIWRLITSIIYFPLSPATGFHYLINLYFLYSYSTRLEQGIFDGRPADFLFLLIFNAICLLLLGCFVTEAVDGCHDPWCLVHLV